MGSFARAKVWRFEPAAIKEVILIDTPVFEDGRGAFSETFNGRVFHENGIAVEFVQDNSSVSVEVGTVRGLHYQSPPYGQAKLVRVVTGRILDVAVDIRQGSSTFGQHVAAELSAENGRQLFVPEGFAHGFVTLEPLTQVAYKVSNFYAPEHDFGILWSDESLGIDWGISPDAGILSEKDAKQPMLADITSPFSL